MVYQVLCVILIAVLLHRFFFKGGKEDAFPPWAALEIALTGYIVKQGGFIRWL